MKSRVLLPDKLITKLIGMQEQQRDIHIVDLVLTEDRVLHEVAILWGTTVYTDYQYLDVDSKEYKSIYLSTEDIIDVIECKE